MTIKCINQQIILNYCRNLNLKNDIQYYLTIKISFEETVITNKFLYNFKSDLIFSNWVINEMGIKVDTYVGDKLPLFWGLRNVTELKICVRYDTRPLPFKICLCKLIMAVNRVSRAPSHSLSRSVSLSICLSFSHIHMH